MKLVLQRTLVLRSLAKVARLTLASRLFAQIMQASRMAMIMSKILQSLPQLGMRMALIGPDRVSIGYGSG